MLEGTLWQVKQYFLSVCIIVVEIFKRLRDELGRQSQVVRA